MTRERAGWMCGACGSGYPVFGEIPWLFPEPRQALAEWRGRWSLLTQHLDAEAAALRAETGSPALPETTRRRLAHLAQANEDQARRLGALLAPLRVEAAGASEATLQALGTRLPTEQGLTNYYVNLHRDWSWGDEENAATLAAIGAALDASPGASPGGRPPGGSSVAERITGLGRTLVQGAGGGRLAYDLHMRGDSPLTVATDFNPLLLFAAREIFAGRSVELYEFPIAPRAIADHAVLRRLAAPRAARAGLELVAADALQPPFADGAFDTVVTPWFIDILGEPLPRVAARINLLLRPGGRWINFGSLAFSRASVAERVTLEEAGEIVTRAGFAPLSTREDIIPYMRSPASRHSRLEHAVTWVTTKLADSPEKPRARQVPDWLVRSDLPVPRTRAFEMQQVSSRVHAFLLALINGERTASDMARMLVEQRLLSAEDAESHVRLFLARLHEDSETHRF